MATRRLVHTTWLITNLKSHPKQAALFRDLSDIEFTYLVDDMAANGLHHPIEILPDGTILCGHQRVRAARELGWKKIPVVIRKDLVNNDKAAEEFMIRDNLLRRQLDPLSRARAMVRAKELEIGRPLSKLSVEQRGDLRDRLARPLGCSGRTVDRYLLILKTPPEIQQAFSAGKISLVDAGRVSLLKPDVQSQIAREIADGGDPAEVVKRWMNGPNGRPRHVQHRSSNVAYHLRRVLKLSDGALEEMAEWEQAHPGNRALFEMAQSTIGKLVGLIKRKTRT